MKWITDFFTAWPIDTVILTWAAQRAVTLYIAYRVAKWAAKLTPWVADDELVQIGEDTYKRFGKK